MNNKFTQMECFVLAGGARNPVNDFTPDGELTHLEKSYRRYAKVFENVRLVLKADQATERYLNYPHICDQESRRSAVVGIQAALAQAQSEAVFIGSTEISEFPLELAADLVRQYNGELFLGYCDSSTEPTRHQPLFGIFSKKLLAQFAEAGQTALDLARFLAQKGRLLPLPTGASGSVLGL
jgi:molybdopterin-guanine dinucleotide biosynthesis protein A